MTQIFQPAFDIGRAGLGVVEDQYLVRAERPLELVIDPEGLLQIRPLVRDPVPLDPIDPHGMQDGLVLMRDDRFGIVQSMQGLTFKE